MTIRHLLPLVLALGTFPLPAADPPKPKLDLHGDPLPDKAVLRLGTVKYRVMNVAGMAFRKSGEFVVVTHKLEVHTFPADGGPKTTVTPLTDDVPERMWTVAVSPDAKYAAAFFDDRREVKVWDISGAKPALHLAHNIPAGSWFSFSPDGRWLGVFNWRSDVDRHAQLCDLATKEFKPLPLPKGWGCGEPAYTADGGRVLIVHTDGEVRVFDTKTCEVVLTAKRPELLERESTINPDGTVLAWVPLNMRRGRDGLGKLIAIEDGKAVKGWTAPTAKANRIGFTPGGKTLWVSDYDRLREWDPAAGKWVHEAAVSIEHTAPVWSADGKRVACLQNSTVVFLDADTWKARNADAVAAGPTDTRFGITVSPDGKVIATDGEAVRLWDAATGKPLGTVKGAGGHGLLVMFLPDGKSFLTPVDGDQITECESATGKELRRFKTASDLKGKVRLGYLSLSTDGKTLTAHAAGDTTPPGENRVRWDVAMGEEIARFAQPRDRLESEYDRDRSPDDQWIALGGSLFRTDEYPKTRAVEVVGRQDAHSAGASWSSDSTLVAFPKRKGDKWKDVREQSSLVVYDVGKMEVRTELTTGWVSRSAFSRDGKLAGVVTADGVAVWDVATGKKVFHTDCPDGHAIVDHSIAFTPDGKRLVTTHGTAALVWDLSAGR